jgi:uncharacterized protein (TIGR03083 family)
MMKSTMDRDAVWAAIDAQRLRVADLLDQLTDRDWGRASLCPDWTVRDVAAHLTLQQLGLRDLVTMLPAMVRARGNLDRTTAALAVRQAGRLTTGQLTAAIRAMTGSRRHNLGVTPRETLIDILVHGQDIAIPLGRTVEIPPHVAAEAATRVWTMRWPPPFPIRRKLAGLRFTATDTTWSVGDGPEVRGPMVALLLLGCGRQVTLSQLSGEGVAELTARLGAGSAGFGARRQYRQEDGGHDEAGGMQAQ